MKITTSTLVFLLFVVTAHPSQAALESKKMAIRSYEQGIAAFSDRNVSTAVKSFVRALLLDPENGPAQSRLHQISQDSSYLPAYQRSQICRFLGLIDTLTFTEKHIRRVHADNIAIINFIQANAPEMDLDDGLHAGIQPVAPLNEVYEIQTVFLSGWDQTDYRLAHINAHLSQTKTGRMNLLKKIQTIHAKLWEMKQRIILESAQKQHVNLSEAFTGKIQKLEDKFKNQQQRLDRQDRLIRNLKRQWFSLRRDYSDLQKKYLKLTRHSDSITNQLAGLHLELFEKDRALADQSHQNEQLKEQLLDTEQRTSLTQKILQEKDRRINTLMSQLSHSTSSTLNALPTTAIDPSKPPPDRLRAMEREIHQLRRQYEQAAHDLEKQDMRIRELQTALSGRDLTIAEMQKAFWVQHHRLTELTGMLTIYKWKLSRAKQSGISSPDQTLVTRRPSLLRQQFVDRNQYQRSLSESITETPVFIIDPRIPLGHNRDFIYLRTKQRVRRLVPPEKKFERLFP